MDTPTPDQPPSIKERVRALLGAGMGSLVLATASLVPQPAEATSASGTRHEGAQRPALSDRVRDLREQIQSEGDSARDGAGKELLAWGNWGNWHNWHNWRNWHN
jgi:hypothetical protein